MARPLLAFIITNHNYAGFLPDALQSCLDQSLAEIEVIVVDDGSTDDSLQVIESFGDSITVVRQHHQGQAAAFNAGFERATADVVALLDADDTADPQRAAEICRAFDLHPDAEWLFHPIRPTDESLEPLVASPDRVTRNVDARRAMGRGSLQRSLPWPIPATSGVALRRSMIDRMGSMPTSSGVTIHDDYIKYTALATAPGVFLGTTLGTQRLHGANAFTAGGDMTIAVARSSIRHAIELRRHGLVPPRFCATLAAYAEDLTATIAPADRPADVTEALAAYDADSSTSERVWRFGKRSLYRARRLMRGHVPPTTMPDLVGSDNDT